VAGSGLTDGAYCTVLDVCTAFPQFQRASPGSIGDTDIQGWINDCKSRIRSALLTPGFETDTATLTTDQKRFLRGLNRDGAIADLGDSLTATITLQPGEISLAAARRKSFETVLKELMDGKHDRLFQPDIAATANVEPMMDGIAGAETDPIETPWDRGENRAFGKNQIF